MQEVETTMDIEHIKEQLVADSEVHDLISRRAFELYLARGGDQGDPAEDWLRAESEILPSLIDEIVEQNRRAIETHDTSDPIVQRAAEHMKQGLETESVASRAMAEQSREAQSTRMRADETDIPNTAALTEKLGQDPAAPTRKSSARKSASSGEVTKKPAAARSTAPKTASKKAAAKKSPAGTAEGSAKKAAAKKPSTRARKTE